MRTKAIATLVLVLVTLPVATAYVPAADGPSATADAQQSSDATEYTKLYIDSDYDNPRLQPGESDEFTVTVKNGENSTVTVDPHLYVPPVGQNLVDASWVTIEGDDTIAAGETAEFTVSVSVPSDATAGYYRGQIAFTDEKVTYPGRPARPVHATHVRVRVWQQPTVRVVSGNSLRGQIEAGDSVTREVVVENTGDAAVPLNPQFENERRNCYGDCPSTIDPAWVDIDSPNRIGAGETATVTVTVSPPEDTERNRYRGSLDLGLKDPAREDRSSNWQQVDMRFEVWSQPAEPFETSFEVNDETENLTLTLSPRSSYYQQSTDEQASFDVEFVRPNGTTVTAERVRLTDSGFVDLSASSDQSATKQGDYAVRSSGQKSVYRIDDPSVGSWQLRITPENTIGFRYEIARNESAS